MSLEVLKHEIITRSVASTWEEAVREWRLKEIFFRNKSTCLCGKNPIKECCVMHNNLNNETVIVGNYCVTKFLGINTDAYFSGIKRTKEDPCKSIGSEMLQYAFRRYWISDWEYNFYTDTLRKRIMSEKQESVRKKINKKILDKFNSK